MSNSNENEQTKQPPIVFRVRAMPIEAFGSPQARLARKLVLLTIATHADSDGGNCYPGILKLAAECGLSDRQIQRHIKWLEDDAHFLKIERKAAPKQTNLFTVLIPGGDIQMSPPSEPAKAPVSPWVVTSRRHQVVVTPECHPTYQTSPTSSPSPGFGSFNTNKPSSSFFEPPTPMSSIPSEKQNGAKTAELRKHLEVIAGQDIDDRAWKQIHDNILRQGGTMEQFIFFVKRPAAISPRLRNRVYGLMQIASGWRARTEGFTFPACFDCSDTGRVRSETAAGMSDYECRKLPYLGEEPCNCTKGKLERAKFPNYDEFLAAREERRPFCLECHNTGRQRDDKSPCTSTACPIVQRTQEQTRNRKAAERELERQKLIADGICPACCGPDADRRGGPPCRVRGRVWSTADRDWDTCAACRGSGEYTPPRDQADAELFQARGARLKTEAVA